MLKIVIIGDTHARHQELSVPDGDVLCHVGDFTDFGEGSGSFFDWLSGLPHPEKLVILGNHEVFTGSESIDFNRSLQAGVKLLLNESIQIEHIVFTGIVAVTPFYLSEKWPRNHSTNVLLSHMPYDGRIAHTRLLPYMYELSPDLRFVFCGHDHTKHGMSEPISGVKVIHAASQDHPDLPLRKSILIEI